MKIMIDLNKISDVDKRALIKTCPACVYKHSVIGDPAKPGIGHTGCHTCGDRGFVLLNIGPRSFACGRHCMHTIIRNAHPKGVCFICDKGPL